MTFSHNGEFIAHNLDFSSKNFRFRSCDSNFLSRNSNFISHNSAFITCNAFFTSVSKVYSSELWVDISQFCCCFFLPWNKMVITTSLHNCEFISINYKFISRKSELKFVSGNLERRQKSQKCEIKNCNYVFIQWWKQASTDNFFLKQTPKSCDSSGSLYRSSNSHNGINLKWNAIEIRLIIDSNLAKLSSQYSKHEKYIWIQFSCFKSMFFSTELTRKYIYSQSFLSSFSPMHSRFVFSTEDAHNAY